MAYPVQGDILTLTVPADLAAQLKLPFPELDLAGGESTAIAAVGCGAPLDVNA